MTNKGKIREIQKLIHGQALDVKLWKEAKTEREALLQFNLRLLHTLIKKQFTPSD